MTIMTRYIKITFTFWLLLVLGIGAASAQQVVDTTRVITVTGKVVSVNDDEPLVGATVVVKGTHLSRITDIEGYFSIQAPKGSTLVVSYAGYDKAEVRVNVNDLLSEKIVRLIPSKPQSGWIYLSAISNPKKKVHLANAIAPAPAACPPRETTIQTSLTH